MTKLANIHFSLRPATAVYGLSARGLRLTAVAVETVNPRALATRSTS